jgi:small GTP-binding protein
VAKQAVKRDKILILGASGAGKTFLMYKLASKNEQMTVTSSEVNFASVKIGEDNSEEIKLVDVPGHFNFRLKLKTFLPSTKKVILLVDSKAKDKLSQAADILYDVIGDIDLAMALVPILIACNK